MLHEYSTQNIEQLVDKIAEHGIGIIDDFLPPITVQALGNEIAALNVQAQLQHAGTGRHSAVVNKDFRGDLIYWLNEHEASAAQQSYFSHMEILRTCLNQHLYLGLFALESHLALYPAGTGYKKHIDRFKVENDGKPLRQISCILYLNQDWQDTYGGHLRMYLDADKPNNPLDVLPTGGRLIVFLSDKFYHEVLPATQDRMSLTAWFLTR